MKCAICNTEFGENETQCPNCGAVVQTNERMATPVENTNTEYIAPAKDEGKVMGLVGMLMSMGAVVLFVVGLLGGCCTMGMTVPFGTVLTFILALISFILCIKARKKSKYLGYRNGCAVFGLILSLISLIVVALISLVILVFVLIYGVAVFAELGALFS